MASVKTIPLFATEAGQAGGASGIERKKKLAEMLMQTQAAPVWSTGQGMLSAGATMLGGLLAKKAGDEETKQEDDAWAEITRAMTGASGLGDAPSPFGASSTGTSAPSQPSFAGSTPSGGRSGGGSRALASNERKQRAMARLTTQHGLPEHVASGIVDNLVDESGLNPLAVGDNGTAFGLAQHRGDRFQNLKKYAASQGKDWKDFDTNLDFIVEEMRQGLDPGAKTAWAQLQEAPDADTAYNAFVTHYERPSKENLNKRLRQVRDQVQAEVSDYPMPELDITEYQAQQQQGLRMMASRNPLLRKQGLLLTTQAQQAIAEAKQAHRKAMFDAQQAAAKERRDRAAKGAEPYTLPPGSARFVGGRKIAEQPKTDSSADIEVGPDGSVRVKTGKLTEQQSKDIGFYDRGAAAEFELRDREEALTDFMSKNAGNVPAIGNYMKSPEYRQAEVAASHFLAAVLRKDTGAAVTPQEFSLYGGMFLPQPGDDADTIRLKRNARAVALKAIKKGLGPAEVLAESYPDLFDGKSLEPKPKTEPGKPGPKDDQPPPNASDEDRKLWRFMTPQDRELLRKHYGRT